MLMVFAVFSVFIFFGSFIVLMYMLAENAEYTKYPIVIAIFTLVANIIVFTSLTEVKDIKEYPIHNVGNVQVAYDGNEIMNVNQLTGQYSDSPTDKLRITHTIYYFLFKWFNDDHRKYSYSYEIIKAEANDSK